MTALTTLLVGVASMPVRSAPDVAITVHPVRIAIVVDESGSILPDALQQERAAAALLGLSELSAQSEVAILGFGSSTGGPGQKAVETYCPLTTLSDAQSRQAVADCANRVHSRSMAEGNDTDHAAALRQALDVLDADDPLHRPRLLFLLTDGLLDVRNSAQYGANPEQRNAEAQRQLSEELLPAARRAGVQIWPLGFGSASLAALEAFAAGGAGPNPRCDRSAKAHPRAAIAGNLSEVARTMLAALGDARCAVVQSSPLRDLMSGGEVDIPVEIPLIATDGSIAVTKLEPRIRVTYFNPAGDEVPKQGSVNGSLYEVSGENSPVEALRIRNPVPGTWRVRLRSISGIPVQRVGATVMWQGVVRSSVILTPVAPRPGERVTVQVRLQTRKGVVVDPAALRGLVFAAEVQGTGFTSFSVGLADGEGPDVRGGDGTFSGQFTLPESATGDATVLGSIQGDGVVGDKRPYVWSTTGRARAPVATFRFDDDDTVERGRSVTGVVTVDNPGDALSARLSLLDLREGVLAEISPTVFALPSGRSQSEFKVRVDKKSRLGQLGARVSLADDAGRPIGEAFLLSQVRRPASLFERFWKALAALAVVAIGAVLGWALRRQRDGQRRRVWGLRACLVQNDLELKPMVHAPQDKQAFSVRVVDESGAVPHLAACPPSAPDAIVIRRDLAAGAIVLQTPGAAERRAKTGQLIPVGEGLALLVTDQRAQPMHAAAAASGNGSEPITAVSDEDDHL